MKTTGSIRVPQNPIFYQEQDTSISRRFCICSEKLEMVVAECSDDSCLFCGKVESSSFISRLINGIDDDLFSMLCHAIDNRTIERNYFKLLSDFLDGLITEEEFDAELLAHEDSYVVSTDIKPSLEQVEKALYIVEKLKHKIDNSSELSTLFSFNPTLTDQHLLAIDAK